MAKAFDWIHLKVKVGGDLDWITRIDVIDAEDRTGVDAKLNNPGWHLLHVGTGKEGQTTLTWGWGDKPTEEEQ